MLHVQAHLQKPAFTLQVVPSGSKERLAVLARQMDVDILVTGHTHEFKVHCWARWQMRPYADKAAPLEITLFVQTLVLCRLTV